jgi:hypothetical protein
MKRNEITLAFCLWQASYFLLAKDVKKTDLNFPKVNSKSMRYLMYISSQFHQQFKSSFSSNFLLQNKNTTYNVITEKMLL